MRWILLLLLLSPFGWGCGQPEKESPPQAASKPKPVEESPSAPSPSEELSRDAAREMLPEAASLSRQEYLAILDSPPVSIGEIPNQSLTALLLAVDPFEALDQNPNVVGDFQYLTPNGFVPNPALIQSAIEGQKRSEFVSLIQPEYITACTCQNRGDTAQGHVEYRAGNVYAGSADFTARKRNNHWQIVAFHLPEYHLTTHRQPDGTWRLESAEELLGIAYP